MRTHTQTYMTLYENPYVPYVVKKIKPHKGI
jgi:hypothetical protein